jgi:hydrogenase nickel incorporation protein HypB
MFRAAEIVLLNKIDLLPHVTFDVARFVEDARAVRPGVTVLEVSASTGAGLARWYAWLREEAGRAGAGP